MQKSLKTNDLQKSQSIRKKNKHQTINTNQKLMRKSRNICNKNTKSQHTTAKKNETYAKTHKKTRNICNNLQKT